MSKRNWIILGVVVVICVVFAVVRLRRSSSQKAAADPAAVNRAIPVAASPVVARDVPIFLSGLGTVTAFNTVTVKSRVDGQLVRVNFKEGQEVKHVRSNTGAQVPLSAFTHYETTNTALAVPHQGQFPATTLSFNLAPGVSLSDAVAAINAVERDMRFPASIHASFQGTAAAFQASLSNQPLLIAAALFAVYIVLGMLYESYIHPITILSTLPSAGVGALLALLLFKTELSIIALIGIILLIGIVKKNAIMMIDFALDAERRQQKSPEESIYQACLLRFRPIMMTTMAALFGALPLAFFGGTGSELRRPLGLTIVGGLIVSQMLTLFTTPVVYLYMDRMRLAVSRTRRKVSAVPGPHTEPLRG